MGKGKQLADMPSYGEETALPLRGIAKSLIDDLRVLGYPDPIEEDRECLPLQLRVVLDLLKSNNLKAISAGLRLLKGIERERRKTRQLELEHVQVGIKALTAYCLAQLRWQTSPGERRTPPEQVTQQVARVMRQLAASEAGEA